MMTELPTEQDSKFQALLESRYGQFEPGDVLQKLRDRAWGHFLGLGLPSRSNDIYRYLRLTNFFSRNYEFGQPLELSPLAIAPHVLAECRQSVLVFVNGYFMPQLSCMEAIPKRMAVTTLIDAMRTYGSFINSQSTKAIKEETDSFAAINTALQCDGLFIYLPPKTVVETPIQLLNIIDAKSTPMLIMPRLQAFIGAQSQLSLVSTQAVLSGDSYAINMVADIAIEEDAHVQYTQVACGSSDDVWHFDALRSQLKRNSTLKTVAVTDGAATVRHDYRVALCGENADVHLNGVWMLQGKKEAHVHVFVDHQAPHCTSMQLFKGALNDFSRSAFEGKIMVRQAAQKTEAFQLNNNLLLSDRAHADSKPNLEIFADDVKASHGATVGQLDSEQVFYMKTRGFSEAAAKNLLVYGFCQEVIDKITVPSVYDSMRKRAQNYLLE